jgi:hypothetical protein
MPFCPHCGSAVEQLPAAAEAAAIIASDEVEIARIQADRDIKVAQITARQERDWNETRLAETEIEAEASVERAEAEAEVIGGILAAETADDAEGEPPVVIADEPGEPEDQAGELAPPEAEHHSAEPRSKPGWVF